MGLRDQASLDAQTFLNDEEGFGWPVTVTDPDGVIVALTGYSNDVAETIDPETGIAVSGRVASVALSLLDLATAGLGIPRSIADSDSAPWVVSFADILGSAHTFKISDANPDRAIGVVTCRLEVYQPTP